MTIQGGALANGGVQGDVNITGNAINLNGTLNASTITTASGNLILGAASSVEIADAITSSNGKNLILGAATGQKIEFDEAITSASGKNLTLGADTGKVVDITQRVVTRYGIIY